MYLHINCSYSHVAAENVECQIFRSMMKTLDNAEFAGPTEICGSCGRVARPHTLDQGAWILIASELVICRLLGQALNPYSLQ